MELKLTTKKEDASITVSMDGEINTMTAAELKTVLDQSIPETDCLRLDFSSCDFVSSAGLRVLLNTYKSMKKKNGRMELQNIGPNFKEVLYITGLDAVFGTRK